MTFKQTGFSLIELMIVVAIIGVLTAIAIPSYDFAVQKAARSEGKGLLLDLSIAQERFFTENLTYTTTLGSGGLGYAVNGDGKVVSENGKYAVGAAACSGKTIADCVLLTADGQGSQANDAACKKLTLSSQGTKGATTSKCW